MFSATLGAAHLLAAIALVAMAFLAVRNARTAQAAGVGVFLAGIALAAGGYGVELAYDAIQVKGQGRALYLAGGGLIGPAFLLLALWLAGDDPGARPRKILAIFVLPSGLGLLAVANGAHELFFRPIGVAPGAVGSLTFQPGILFWPYVLILLGFVVGGIVILARASATISMRHRAAVRQLVVLSVFPVLLGYLSVIGWELFGSFSALPASLVVVGIAFFSVILRNEFLDLRPVARDLLMERFPDGIIVIDRSDMIVDHNAEALRLLDLTPPILGRSASEVLASVPRATARALLGTQVEVELSGRILELRVARLTRRNGRDAGIVLQIHDCTDTRNAERALAASLHRESQLGALGRALSVARPLEDLPGIALPLIGQIVEADECSMQIDVNGVALGATWTPETGVRACEERGLLALTRNVHGLTLMLDAHGTSAGVLSCARGRAFEPADEAVAETARWMLANALSNTLLIHEMERAARTDPLTGLENRASFLKAGEREVSISRRHHRPLALALCDLDHFKSFNDRFGHACGDAILVETARRILESVRATDVVCRWGGEEFAILMPDADLANGRAVAERVRRSFEARPFDLDVGNTVVTISIGVAALDHGSAEWLAALTERADRALYGAKRAGRNRVEIDEQLLFSGIGQT